MIHPHPLVSVFSAVAAIEWGSELSDQPPQGSNCSRKAIPTAQEHFTTPITQPGHLSLSAA
jgi:hypothetical protein